MVLRPISRGAARAGALGLLVLAAAGCYRTVPVELDRVAVRQEGFRFETLHQRLLLEPGDVVLLERREIDWPRTGLLVGVAGTVVAALAVDPLSGDAGGNTIGRPPGDGSSDVRLPRLRIPVP